MRINQIQERKRHYSEGVQAADPVFDATDFETAAHHFSIVDTDSVKRKVSKIIGSLVLDLEQPFIRARLKSSLAIKYNTLSFGERFSDDASLSCFLKLSQPQTSFKVLVPGCGVGGQDVQLWLRYGVKQVYGIDVYPLNHYWRKTIPALSTHFDARVELRQGSLESLPFEDKTFDLMSSQAVLEHVRNLRLAVDEMARVLRPGGWAWHCFGPLFFTHAGDHCINAYGDDHGYDHLLLDESEYLSLVNDQEFFDTQPDPHCNYWAKMDQFSFLTPEEYIREFLRHFEIKHVLVKVSPEGLAFRDRHASTWSRLIAAGISETALLIKGLNIVMRKKSNECAPNLA